VKQKSLQRPPTIRFTDFVLRTGFLIIILRFGGGGGGGGVAVVVAVAVVVVAISTSPQIVKSVHS